MIVDLPSADAVAQWLGETLLASGLLLALVLLVRRSVARRFGPQLAYALWAIPALRMVLPPLPVASEAFAPADAVAAVPAATLAAAPAATVATPLTGQDWLALPIWWPMELAALWAAGVLAHLLWQIRMHRKLLRLLDNAEPVGQSGRVRLFTSPAVDGPMSFGMLRPVVVLPPAEQLGFGRAEHDLAIAHELTHHRRGDLWANGAACLFAALHWFNPLTGMAWRAFRFDQEAACDAMVLNRADGATRSLYARALAKVATGRPAIFSPPRLASPMLGAEQLKERVSMLAQPTPSRVRRRFGTAMVITALFGAMAATASTFAVEAQEAPAPPAPPPAPAAPMPPAGIATVDVSTGEAAHVTRIEREGATIILHTDHAPSPAEIDALVAEAVASRAEAERAAGQAGVARVEAQAARGEAAAAAGEARRQVRTIMIRRHGEGETVDVAGAPPAPPVPPVPPVPPAPPVPPVPGEHRVVIRTTGGHGAPIALQGCRAGTTPLVNIDQQSGEGREVNRVRIINCVQSEASVAQRLAAMRQARESLASADRAAMGEARTAALRELDRQIAALEREAR